MYIIQGKMADHMGQVHNYVDKYLPEENRIPMKVQVQNFDIRFGI
jgi:hypothetical protein